MYPKPQNPNAFRCTETYATIWSTATGYDMLISRNLIDLDGSVMARNRRRYANISAASMERFYALCQRANHGVPCCDILIDGEIGLADAFRRWPSYFTNL